MTLPYNTVCQPVVFAGDHHRHRSQGDDRCRFGASVLQAGPSAGLAPTLCGFSCWWWQVCDENGLLYTNCRLNMFLMIHDTMQQNNACNVSARYQYGGWNRFCLLNHSCVSTIKKSFLLRLQWLIIMSPLELGKSWLRKHARFMFASQKRSLILEGALPVSEREQCPVWHFRNWTKVQKLHIYVILALEISFHDRTNSRICFTRLIIYLANDSSVSRCWKKL